MEETDRIILEQEITPFIFDKTQEGDNEHDVALQHEQINFDAHHGIYASISMKINHYIFKKVCNLDLCSLIFAILIFSTFCWRPGLPTQANISLFSQSERSRVVRNYY